MLHSDEELYFRNLDGTATQHREVFPEDGLLRTHVRNTSLSRLGAMTIVGFEVECFVGDALVFDMTTTFGFFPAAGLANPAGSLSYTHPPAPETVLDLVFPLSFLKKNKPLIR